MILLREIRPEEGKDILLNSTSCWVGRIVKIHIRAPASTQSNVRVDYSTKYLQENVQKRSLLQIALFKIYLLFEGSGQIKPILILVFTTQSITQLQTVTKYLFFFFFFFKTNGKETRNTKA